MNSTCSILVFIVNTVSKIQFLLFSCCDQFSSCRLTQHMYAHSLCKVSLCFLSCILDMNVIKYNNKHFLFSNIFRCEKQDFKLHTSRSLAQCSSSVEATLLNTSANLGKKHDLPVMDYCL